MKLVIGCPVKSRAWVLPRWFNAIYSQDFDDLFVEIVCIMSKSDDDTEEILKQGGATVIRDPYPGRSSIDIDGHHWGLPENYRYMAEIRNELLEYVIRSKADYFFSLDSDIILPEDGFETLFEILMPHPGVVAPAVNMAVGEVSYNVMDWAGPGMAERLYPRNQGGPADVVMAAMLMDRKGMEARWAEHHQGEDVGFCFDAYQKGVSLWWEPSVACEHLMIRSS